MTDDDNNDATKMAAAQKEANKLVEKSSNTLSSRVRSLNVGVLAVNWAVLVGDKTIGRGLTPGLRWQLLAVCALVVVGFGLDCLQYFSSYVLYSKVARDIDKGKLNQVSFNPHHRAYIMAKVAFRTKLWIGLITFSWFVGLFAFILSKA